MCFIIILKKSKVKEYFHWNFYILYFRDMSHNKLQAIYAKTFDKLYSLKRLILSDNLITYIEEGAFQALGALQYL